ncbi:hypothetical protein JOE31_002563 [Arthrobacter sp. PvP023]|uniref:hypothetical protein n=1 Tax=Pseudarthrobacter sp. PvP022 TaxID=3156433 RepID=UPI001B4C9A21|nr:hypothetical protein [Arthrobacter sp. PvP023]
MAQPRVALQLGIKRRRQSHHHAHEREPMTMTDGERATYRLSLALSGEASSEAVRVIVAVLSRAATDDS